MQAEQQLLSDQDRQTSQLPGQRRWSESMSVNILPGMASARAGFGPARPIDPVAAARTRSRLERAQRAPWLHEEAARRMAERLPLIRRKPQRVVDWWAHAGGSDAALRAVLPEARIERRGPMPPDVTASTPWWRRFWSREVADKQQQAPADLVWANMLLQHESDPLALMRLWHEALDQQGFLMFSTLGPGSLTGLRHLYGSQGWGPSMADLVDMHDIGDMLVEAGFADPVMDQEIVRLTWSSPEAALQELHDLGSNAHPMRLAGLRTPRWKQRLMQALRGDPVPTGEVRVVLEFELVYGHAFKPLPRHRVAAETRIDLEDLRSSLRHKGKQA